MRIVSPVAAQAGRKFSRRINKGFMKIELLEDLYAGKALKLLDAERQQQNALPKFLEAVTAVELRESLEKHIEQTKGQLERLEKIAGRFDGGTDSESKAMKGIVEEGLEFLSAGLETDLLDAALIGSLLAAESHEIACYVSLENLAKLLGRQDEAELKKKRWMTSCSL